MTLQDLGAAPSAPQDLTTVQWVQAAIASAIAASGAVTVGTIIAYAGTDTPTGYLECNGTTYSRTTYSALFAKTGTVYGTGDGSTTFAVPNLQGRVLVGRDTTQSEFSTMGLAGGEKTHQLNTNEMPAHTHTYTGPYSGVNTTAYQGGFNNYTQTGAVAAETASNGGNAAHNNLQPYGVIRYLIKT